MKTWLNRDVVRAIDEVLQSVKGKEPRLSCEVESVNPEKAVDAIASTIRSWKRDFVLSYFDVGKATRDCIVDTTSTEIEGILVAAVKSSEVVGFTDVTTLGGCSIDFDQVKDGLVDVLVTAWGHRRSTVETLAIKLPGAVEFFQPRATGGYLDFVEYDEDGSKTVPRLHRLLEEHDVKRNSKGSRLASVELFLGLIGESALEMKDDVHYWIENQPDNHGGVLSESDASRTFFARIFENTIREFADVLISITNEHPVTKLAVHGMPVSTQAKNIIEKYGLVIEREIAGGFVAIVK